MNAAPKPPNRVSIALPPPLLAELKRLAAEGNRPISREAQAAIRAHVSRERRREGQR